jgi:DNA-binding MarR family transcriptional regulator
MNLTPEQYQTLYAISKLKAPLSNGIAALIGAPRKTTTNRLNRLITVGLVSSSTYYGQRMIYMMTSEGRDALTKYLEINAAPELVSANYAVTFQTKDVPKPKPAPSNSINKLSGTYYTGMGDTPVYYRPGSLDFLKCPSRGHRC